MINEHRRGRGPGINPLDGKLPALLYSGKVGDSPHSNGRVEKGHERIVVGTVMMAYLAVNYILVQNRGFVTIVKVKVDIAGNLY